MKTKLADKVFTVVTLTDTYCNDKGIVTYFSRGKEYYVDGVEVDEHTYNKFYMKYLREGNHLMKEEDHEVSACYSLYPPTLRHEPCILCPCGWSYIDTNWEDVGFAYDDHLEEVGVR